MHGVILPRPQRCCEKDDAMQRISDKWSLRPLLYETRLELAYRASGRSLETRRIPTVSPRESSRHIEIKYVCNSKSTVLLFVCICICSIFSPSSPLLVSSSPFAMADDLFSPHPSSPSVAPSYFNPISPLFNAYDRFAQWRADLGLPHPGTVENLQKEAKGLSSLYLLFSLLNNLQTQPPISPTSSLTEPAQTWQRACQWTRFSKSHMLSLLVLKPSRHPIILELSLPIKGYVAERSRNQNVTDTT